MSASSDLGALGSPIGFGNTRWGGGAGNDTFARPTGITHGFAGNTNHPGTPESSSDGPKEQDVTTNNDDDDDDHDADNNDTNGEETSGLGENYQVVDKTEQDNAAGNGP